MKIALLGYGKMGQIIERFAQERGHQVVLKITRENLVELNLENLRKADVAIDFSTPEAVLGNIDLCYEAGLPIVVGTTGWYNQLVKVRNKYTNSNNSLLFGSNFSIGVNLFFYINKQVAKLMNNYPAYEVSVEEIHHLQKLDAPSGTAITISEDILMEIDKKQNWVNEFKTDSAEDLAFQEDQLVIKSIREDKVPGTHIVKYSSDIDDIALIHTAHNRNGFAFGAVLAAEWLIGKKGFFEVKEMFEFNNQK